MRYSKQQHETMPSMREISPAVNCSAEDFLRVFPSEVHQLVAEIRRQKQEGLRILPSTSLLDHSTLLTRVYRHRLLDAVAALVDENLFGRSEMCLQFADLLCRALIHLGLPAKFVSGWAIYFTAAGQEVFRWKHTWVRVESEAIDGNVDSLFENPTVPKGVKLAPYWGPIAQMPSDRRLREERCSPLPPDQDVSDTWWPELRAWLDKELSPKLLAKPE